MKFLEIIMNKLAGKYVGKENIKATREEFEKDLSELWRTPLIIWSVISDNPDLRESYKHWLNVCRTYGYDPMSQYVTPPDTSSIYLNPYMTYLKDNLKNEQQDNN